ncbi:MAG: hypothetical protein JXA28_03215 [Bacteroidetes bacterium]|nr:hypothetical protein [Bacteroidota bacterium]
MKETGGQQTYIRTPVELDMAFRALERMADRSASPLRHFKLLTDFLAHTQGFPSAWLGSYGSALFHRAESLVEHNYLSGGDPQRWMSLLGFLDACFRQGWIPADDRLQRTRDAATAHTIYTHICVRSFRPLHELLLARGLPLRAIPETEWSVILNADTFGRDPFATYIEHALSPGAPVPDVLLAARQQWKHAREEGGIGVVLLDVAEGCEGGTVLRLDLQSRRNARMHVHFTSDIAHDNTETLRQLQRCARLAAELVIRRFGVAPPAREYSFAFHDRAAEFRGASMGLGAALLMAVDMQRHFNRALRWHLVPYLACTGSLDENGNVYPVPDHLLRRKVQIAFFSHADALVLAASQREQATRFVRALQQHYPSRQLQIHGVGTLDDCAAAEGILRSEHRNVPDRMIEFIRDHAVLLLVTIVLLLGGYTGFLLWKYYYDFPDLERTSGKIPENGAVVYNPKADDPWSYRDGAQHKPAVLPFGDLEVGDGFFRNVYIHNFGRSRLGLDISVEGPDAEDWYCNWNGGRQEIASTEKLRMMVMFAPLRPGRKKTARLVLKNADTGEELYALRLQGSAGMPQPAGYALRLDGFDDMLVFGDRSYPFAMENATIEMWLRPDTTHACLYADSFNPPDGQAIANMTFSIRSDTLDVNFADIVRNIPLPPEARISRGEWTHFAFTYRHPDEDAHGRLTVLVNGTVVFDHEDDFLVENLYRPYVTIGAYHNGFTSGGLYRGEIDELRLWRGYHTPEVIRERMHWRVDGRTPGLRGYWDMDTGCEVSVYPAYKSAQDAVPVGRPTPVRSTAPVEVEEAPGVRLVDGIFSCSGSALEIAPFTYLHCPRQILLRETERTYAIRFRQDNPSDIERVLLAVANQDAWIQMLTTGFAANGSHGDIRRRQYPDGWVDLVVRIDASGAADCFINGGLHIRLLSDDLQRGPFYRYYGLQVGFFFDGYNHFRTAYYEGMRPLLEAPCVVADLRVWDRALTDAEIRGMVGGALPRAGLNAWWPLDALPDAYGNISDVLHGYPLHVRRVRMWE